MKPQVHLIYKYLRGRGVYPKTGALIFQVDFPSL
jgi:tRNA splicing endonuclease